MDESRDNVQRQPNFANRTLFVGDNLPMLRAIDTGVVDMIYLDPPFNTNRYFNSPLRQSLLHDTEADTEVLEAEFNDVWSMSGVKEDWADFQQYANPALHAVVRAARLAHSDSMEAYTVFMAQRVKELHRVLREDGVLFLHCDDHASHYLKMLLDCVFGRGKFVNDIIWKRTTWRSDGNRFGRIHDNILVYSKSIQYTWNQQYSEADPDVPDPLYTRNDDDGRGWWRPTPLTASGVRSGDSGQEWHGIDPGLVGKGAHWRTPTQGAMNDFIVEHALIPGWPTDYPSVRDRLTALDEAGLVHWGERMPNLKFYWAANRGKAQCDIVWDIANVGAGADESTGYPTQKPLKLLQMLIRSTTKPGDWILDPFCGCASALIAAEKEGRKWVGIDRNVKAVDMVRMRLMREVVDSSSQMIRGSADDVINTEGIADRVTVAYEPPSRTDGGDQRPKTKHAELRKVLLNIQNYMCPGCARVCEHGGLTEADFQVDHVIPTAEGGEDYDDNKQALCSTCNRLKGTGSMAALWNHTELPGKRPAIPPARYDPAAIDSGP